MYDIVHYLENNGYIQTGPFDAQLHRRAEINDIDPEKVVRFVRQAKARRGFPLEETTSVSRVVNAIVHRNYADNGSVEVILLAGYIEQLGTGIQDMIERLKQHGLPEPEFLQEEMFSTSIYRLTAQDAMQVSPALKNLIRVMINEHSREELQEKLQMQNRDYFRKAYINEALEAGWIEQTLPDKPISRNQKYRLTEKGKLLKRTLENKTIGYGRNQ